MIMYWQGGRHYNELGRVHRAQATDGRGGEGGESWVALSADSELHITLGVKGAQLTKRLPCLALPLTLSAMWNSVP